MTTEWLSHHVFQDAHKVLASSIVPGSVHSGKQSTVVKLQIEYLEFPGEAESQSQKTTTKKTLFVKRYVKNELPPRSESHWTRDLYSYRTESRFYSHFYTTLSAFDVPLIKPLAVLYAKDTQGNEATDRFMVILESVDDLIQNQQQQQQAYVHADCLKVDDAKQALTYLASLHAAGLKNPGLVVQAAQDLWPSGGWWSFAKRGGMPALKDTPRIWESVRTSFAYELTEQTTRRSDSVHENASLESLAERMMRHAAYISSELFENSPEYLKTIVHGDFKSANLFFKAQSREVVAFDWQWCGVGIGALDVAYLLNTSVSIEALTDGNEDKLLRWYYDQLVLRLSETQVLRTQILNAYPFEAFERHYVLATLEYARVLISNFWTGMTPQTCAAKFANTNSSLGYRSVPHVLRMIEKLEQGLHFVEQEQERTIY